jgi:hypothetical protein
MRNAIVIFFFFFGAIFANAQKVVSSCTAPDSIISKYIDDADRLALRKFYRHNLSYKDSIIIPQTHADSALHALVAVYNATTLAARDTVVTQFHIHTFPNWVMNSIIVEADSNLSWMLQLKLGNLLTGNASVDSLITKYRLKLDHYYHYSNVFSYDIVVFKSDSNYNIFPMTKLFETIPGVYFSDLNGVIGDGNNITDSIYTDHIELIYSVGWDDCPSGCIARRFWKFNVYFDCSVDFVGSYGNVLPKTGITYINDRGFSIYPNPFNETIFIDGVTGPFVFSITNLIGQELITGQSANNRIDKLDKLTMGVYILTIKTDNKTAVFKMCKK